MLWWRILQTPQKVILLHWRGFIVATLMLFLLTLQFGIFSLEEFEIVDGRPNVMCVNKKLALTSPNTDGLVMNNKSPFSHWKQFTNVYETNQRIFFHETSGRNELGLKQCCVIESAAKNNPDRPVQLFLRPSTDCSTESSLSETLHSPPWLEVLSQYPNVVSVLVNDHHYFSGTPLEAWYNRGEWRKSRFNTAHLADYIRILTLYKGGGLYLDLDILILKSLSDTKFRNCLVFEDALKNDIGNSVMHLESGHWLPTEIMKRIGEDYDPEDYSYHGPIAVKKVMSDFCAVEDGKPMPVKCKDIHLLNRKHFYPIPSYLSQTLFSYNGNKTDIKTLAKIKKSYGLHLWNSLKHIHEPIKLNSNQVFSILARQHCPLTVAKASDFKIL